MVFVRSYNDAKVMHNCLESSGFQVTIHHNNLSDSVKDENLAKFMDGKKRFVVCTSGLKAGIDPEKVQFIFHIGFPDTGRIRPERW